MDSTGRLLKYDAKTKEVTVLFRNLSLAAGVAVDEEEKFVMVTDFTANRTRKITHFRFWLAAAWVDPRIDSGLLPTGVRINGNGTVLETVNLERWYGNKSVFEVQEFAISFTKIRLPKNATGPEALAFELTIPRFFTGIADGRILKYLGPAIGFEEFGFAAPNRPKSVCDGTETANPNPVCGRPLGMALHHRTNQLYVCDAFFRFGVLGPRGGLVTQLSIAADGEPYRFCNGVDVHQPTGNVYFTNASSIFDIT
ncbi:hypothetical protein Gotur_026143 [Gossypium turneri]